MASASKRKMSNSDAESSKQPTPAIDITHSVEKTEFHEPIFNESHPKYFSIDKSVSPFEISGKLRPSDGDNSKQESESSHKDLDSDELRIGTKPNMDFPNFVELLEEQIDLRLASSNNPTIVLELDLDGNVQYLSKNWELIVGTNSRKIIGKPISNIIIGSSEEDLYVFHNAIKEMIVNDGSYKVKFVTATDDLKKHISKGNDGNITPHNSTTDLKNLNEIYNEMYESPQPRVEGVSDEEDANSSLSSKLSNNGDVIELEAQGILIHDSTTKLPTHSMWTIKRFTHLDLDLTLPSSLIDLLGFGAEIFEGYLLNLKERGIIDEDSVPQPKLILCRICESLIPAWFIERHSDLCIVEYRVNEELQNCHDAVGEKKGLILKIIDSLQNNSSPLSSSVSSGSSNSSTSSLILEYNGFPLPMVLEGSPRGSSSSLKPINPILQNRKFPFGILQRLVELCDEALLINPAECNAEGEFQFSPSSQNAQKILSNWKAFETSDPAIRSIIEDTQVAINAKLECISRLVSILKYSEKIKQEVDSLVLRTVKETVSKIKEQTLMNELKYSENSSRESLNSNVMLSPPTKSTKILSPIPSRTRSPQGIFSEQFFSDGVKSLSPHDILLNKEFLPDRISRTSLPVSDKHRINLQPNQPNTSDDLMITFNDMDLNKKSSETFSNNSSFSSPRRHLSPIPYVEKQNLSSFQRNTNSRFESNTPSSSPSVYGNDISDSIVNSEKRTSSFGTNNSGGGHSNKSSISKPPLSPLLSLLTPSSKPVSGGVRDYEILKPLSKGAFGSVFLAQRKLTGEYVAIKCLKKRDMIAKNQILNVKSERAVMMRQTDSPYVAQLYSTFQSKDYLYLVMEYLNGGDCATLVKALGTLGDDWAKRYIAEVIVGVDDLHRRGIIHRDLKPDNLLIDSKGHLKLIDFGLSRMGVIRRQVTSHRKSSTSEQAIELFRKNFGPQASQSPSIPNSAINTSEDSPLLEVYHKRTSSVTPFSLSPTLETSKLSYMGIGSPSFTYPEYNTQTPLNKGNPYIKLRTSSNSSGLDSPLIGPVVPRTNSESSFAIMEEDYQASPMQNITSYALFDPQDNSEIKKFVGTPDYLAPETIEGVGQSEVSDWWSIGCILFEFLFGYAPFHASTPDMVFKNILKGEIDWPNLSEEEERSLCSLEAKDLIKSLLTLNPEERLGINGADEIKSHPYFKNINWDTLFEEEASFIPNDSTDYSDLRGADASQFPQEDSDSDENKQQDGTGSSSGQSLFIPPNQNSGKKERRGSRLADPSEFGSFHFRNLNVLEKANKDVINRLKTEHLEHRNSFSSSSSDSTPISRSRGYSFTGSNPSPFKRAMSPVTPILRSSSPTKESTTSVNSGRVSTLSYSSGDEAAFEKGLPHGENIPKKKSINSLSKQVLKNVEFSPSNSDTEDSALWRVKKRRESARRVGSFSASDQQLIRLAEIDVLYCEPIPIVRHSVSKLLEKAGCIVVSISDGDELVRRATSQVKFDIIFTGLKLPKVGGIDAAKLIRYTTGVNTETPIIALTGFKQEAVESGIFSDVIEKPIKSFDLQRCIEKFISANDNDNDNAIESDSEK